LEGKSKRQHKKKRNGESSVLPMVVHGNLNRGKDE